jgi:hypothetical protein
MAASSSGLGIVGAAIAVALGIEGAGAAGAAGAAHDNAPLIPDVMMVHQSIKLVPKTLEGTIVLDHNAKMECWVTNLLSRERKSLGKGSFDLLFQGAACTLFGMIEQG